MKATIEINLPNMLLQQANQFIKDGWALSMDELLAEALRRYLDSHKADRMESFIREDVEWGLHGKKWLKRQCDRNK